MWSNIELVHLIKYILETYLARKPDISYFTLGLKNCLPSIRIRLGKSISRVIQKVVPSFQAATSISLTCSPVCKRNDRAKLTDRTTGYLFDEVPPGRRLVIVSGE